MEKLTPEQFKSRFGDEAVNQLSEINATRLGRNSNSGGVSSKVKDFGIGFAKGLGDSLYGTANLMVEGGRYVQGAVAPGKTVRDFQAEAEQSGNTKPWWMQPFAGENQSRTEEALKSDNPTQTAGKVAEFGAEILTPAGWFTKSAGLLSRGNKINKTIKATEEVAKPSTMAKVENAVDNVMSNKTVQGVTQKAEEMIDRVPRFVGRVQDDIQEASVRSQKIKTSKPPVANAYKVGVPDKFINTVQEADKPTLEAYKEIIDIADNPGATFKPTQRPEIIAGNKASEQYKLIDEARKDIGEQIGTAVDKLSKNGSVDVLPAQRQMRDVLSANGIKPNQGGALGFTGKFTPAERAKIQQLYDLATEGGENLTPRQIYDMDRLFSKLQREARFENVGDIMVSTPNGEMSLFRVFRDIYSNQLDEVAPEIRDLNRGYRNFVTLQDDIERSIIRSGNYESTKGIDDAEFAQTNLRRLFSESSSASDYRAIYEEMDKVSRSLGYDGARADDLAVFAYELRKLYPETTPRTGFEGSIRSVLGNIADKVSTVGAPNEEDQRKALKQLIDFLMEQEPT